MPRPDLIGDRLTDRYFVLGCHMKRYNGALLALGATLGLVAAGGLVRRGSRGLDDIRLQGGPPRKVSQPFMGIVGAARGGPKLEVYQRALERAPFDLTVVLSGEPSRRENAWQYSDPVGRLRPWAERYVRDRIRGPIPHGRVIFLSPIPPEADRADLVNRFALMSPHALAHRLFDMAVSYQPVADKLSTEFSSQASEYDARPSDKAKERLQVFVSDSIQEGFDFGTGRGAFPPEGLSEEEEDELRDEVFGQAYDRLLCAMSDLLSFISAWNNVEELLEQVDFSTIEQAGLLMTSEDMGEYEFIGRRIFSSLICPTAAGRRSILGDQIQMGAECFAVWCMSYNTTKGRGSIPLMTIEPEELTRFSAEAWANKWAQSGSRKATERNVQQYIEALKPYEPFFRGLSQEQATKISRWSKLSAQRANAAMLGAVELLKAYGVVVD